MTKLIVTPIDMAAKGSYGERKRLLRAIRDLNVAKDTNDIGALVDAYDTFEALVTQHLETDDGTPVGEALEQASAEEFDQLLGALLQRETVPNSNSAS